jgi:hypothetical protein
MKHSPEKRFGSTEGHPSTGLVAKNFYARVQPGNFFFKGRLRGLKFFGLKSNS